MSGQQRGGCQCGAVRYRFSAEPLTLYLCHCTECQKQSSSAFGMSLWLRREDLEFLSGALKFWQRGSDSGGIAVCAFCPDCGTRLYHADSHDSEIVSLKAGSLDDPSWLRPAGHIWTRSAQPWVAPWVATDRSAGALVYEAQPRRDDELIARYRRMRDANSRDVGP